MSDEVTFFVNELADAEDKLLVIQKLGTLLDSMSEGEQIVRSELLPILHDMIASEEENACTWELAITGYPALFRKWPRILPCLTDTYLKILEHEERAIRDAGLTGIGKMLKFDKSGEGVKSSAQSARSNSETSAAELRTVKEFSNLYESLMMVCKVRNLHYGKASCADLFALLYPHISPNSRRALLPSYICLASDDHPLTRKAVAASLVKIVDQASAEELATSIYQAIVTGWKDEYIEQVRVDATTSLMRTCPKLAPEKYVVPVLNDVASDPSWRVRLSFLNNVSRFMAECPNDDIIRDLCWANIIELMSDNINEVSNKAYQTVHDCSEFLYRDIYMTKVAPKIAEIMFDSSVGAPTSNNMSGTSTIAASHSDPVPGSLGVKVGIMDCDEEACCAICDIIIDGTQYLDKSVLLEYVGILAAHQLGCVRTRLASHMATIVRALEQELCLSLIWSLVRDRQWRVRAEITKQLPCIAPRIERNAVVKLFITTLLDLCDQVRLNAVEGVRTILLENTMCADGASVLPYITELLLRLWQINHGTPQAGTGETPNTAVTTNPMLSEILSNCAKRNIRSYIVTKTLIAVICALYSAVDANSKSIIMKDVIVPSSQEVLPNIRYVAWKNVSMLLEAGQLDSASIKSQYSAQVNIETDRDVQAILNRVNNLLL